MQALFPSLILCAPAFSLMAQVLAMDLFHTERLLPPRSKRDSFASSGRGGSGNVRRLFISTNIDDTVGTEAEMQAHTHLTSSGRGGSGNIHMSTSASGLQTHPLTAAIINQHNAMEAQYEERVRKAHAEANVIRSSGRGGSGNISKPRRQSVTQSESKSASKKHFFLNKGKARDTGSLDGGEEVHGTEIMQADKRNSRATYSSGNSSDIGTIYSYSTSNESRVSHAMASSTSVISEPVPNGGEATSQPRYRRIRWSRGSSSASSSLFSPTSRSSPLTVSAPPPSIHTGSPTSTRIQFPGEVILEEDREYLSFLDLDS